MNSAKLGFIGGGNMARSIIGGLQARGSTQYQIIVSDPDPDSLVALKRDFGVQTTSDNLVAVEEVDILVLAVKPQVLKDVCLTVRGHLPPGTLVISIAAGITCQSLENWLGPVPVVRCMPNTPALVQAGASGLFANAAASDAHRHLATAILEAVGLVCWVDEEHLIDAVTAVSGSGPAYFFLMIEAMTDAGEQMGLDRQTAAQLAIQTAAGAAKLAAGSDLDTAELRRRVTSPGGTTERAIAVFEAHDLRGTVRAALTACADRSVELARILGS